MKRVKTFLTLVGAPSLSGLWVLGFGAALWGHRVGAYLAWSFVIALCCAWALILAGICGLFGKRQRPQRYPVPTFEHNGVLVVDNRCLPDEHSYDYIWEVGQARAVGRVCVSCGSYEPLVMNDEPYGPTYGQVHVWAD